VDPVRLRTLDAIHLAAALSLGDEVGAMFTYDGRLADAARQYGLEVREPA
jgi:predicted nucleic acid-binding protein